MMEKAVKYSETEGAKKVSYQSLKKALQKKFIPITPTLRHKNSATRPDINSGPIYRSAFRVKEHLASLRNQIKEKKVWCVHQRKGIEKARTWVLNMERS